MADPPYHITTCRQAGCGQMVIWKRYETTGEDDSQGHLAFGPKRWTHHPEEPGQNNTRCPGLVKNEDYDSLGHTRTSTTGPSALPSAYCAEDSYSRSESDWVMCNRPANNKTPTKGTPVCGMHVRKLTQAEAEEEEREQAQALREWQRAEEARIREKENAEIQRIADRCKELGLEVELKYRGWGETKWFTGEAEVNLHQLVDLINELVGQRG